MILQCYITSKVIELINLVNEEIILKSLLSIQFLPFMIGKPQLFQVKILHVPQEPSFYLKYKKLAHSFVGFFSLQIIGNGSYMDIDLKSSVTHQSHVSLFCKEIYQILRMIVFISVLCHILLYITVAMSNEYRGKNFYAQCRKRFLLTINDDHKQLVCFC